MASMVAFQAVDPGSTPGRRSLFEKQILKLFLKRKIFVPVALWFYCRIEKIPISFVLCPINVDFVLQL